MTISARFFASLTLTAIAAFLIFYTWVPSSGSLKHEEGQVTNIISRPNTWYEVEIITSSGARVSCRARRGWPLLGPSRCPLEKFEQFRGQPLVVRHDGKRPYQVSAGSESIIAYSAYRQAQFIAVAISLIMMVSAFWLWKRG